MKVIILLIIELLYLFYEFKVFCLWSCLFIVEGRINQITWKILNSTHSRVEIPKLLQQ